MTAEIDVDGVPAGAPIVPARITLALDARGLYGPDVDTACGTSEGNPGGDVDDWELGVAEPTRDQVRLLAALVRLLAALVRLPVSYFYLPYTPTPGWICRSSRGRGGGCVPFDGVVRPPAAAEAAPKHRQAALW